MVQLNRVRVASTGFQGGPGVSTFYFRGLQTARQSLQTLYTALAVYSPNVVFFQVESAGDVIESTNGDLVGSWAQDPLPAIQGGGTGAYAAPAGMMLRWDTQSIVASRRVRGRTFIVPLSSFMYQDNGSLAPNVPGLVNALMASFIFEQSLDFVIWSRPFPGAAATPTRGARPARLGTSSLVTSGVVPDRVAVLRSRRD